MMMSRMMPRRGTRGAAAASVVILLVAGGRVLSAQGSVSVQGLGYPPGQLSTRALGTAGALGEVDASSPLNPAALAISPVAEVYAQYDPELRRVTGPGGSGAATVARFPNAGATLPISPRLVLGLSASTLLDRTFSTTTQRTQVFGPSDTVGTTESLRSEGGITDVRLAAGYRLGPVIRLGIAGHLYTGSDRITARNTFSDTLRYRSVMQQTTLSFSGRAASAGIEVDLVPRKLALALDGRKGTTIRMFAGDSVMTQATVPDRYGASLSFSGLPGTLVSVRAARERWSVLTPLSTTGSRADDATDVAAGIESRGPRFGGGAVLVRLGARRRTLPFAAAGMTVTETSFGGGIGLPFARDRISIDLAALRALRTAPSGVKESAYLLSMGLRLRP